MARKIKEVKEILYEKLLELQNDPEDYMNFLDTGAHFYKYSFESQVLITAQKPEATACASYDFWQKNMNRQVLRGKKGIALIGGNNRVNYIFDVTDTIGESIPNVWKLSDDEQKLLLTNNDKFNTIEEYIKFKIIKDYSNIIPVQDEYEKIFLDTCTYKILSRCGVSKDDLHKKYDFSKIKSMSGKEFKELGIRTSYICKTIINDISEEISNINLENNKDMHYNALKRTSERVKGEIENGDQIQTGRGSTYSGSRRYSDRRTESDREILKSTSDISTGTEAGGRNSVTSRERNEQSLEADRRRSMGNGRENRRRTEQEERDSKEPEELRISGDSGREKLYQTDGNRNSDERTDIRLKPESLEYYDRRMEDNRLPFFNGVEKVLLSAELTESKESISKYIRHENYDITVEYVRELFKKPEEEIVIDGEKYGYKMYSNVLHLYTGSRENRQSEAYYDWDVIKNYFTDLELTSNLKSYEEFNPLPEISDKVIDRELKRGGVFENSKFRIYEYFKENRSSVDRINFLKQEYGSGGHSHLIRYRSSFVDYSAKGINLTIGNYFNGNELLIKWNEVANRIDSLIKTNSYLYSSEIEKYNEWKKLRDETKEKSYKAENTNYKYEVGSEIYIGAKQYKIIDITDDKITLFDFDLPLINQEFEKDNFIKRLSENPLNDNLIINGENVSKDEAIHEIFNTTEEQVSPLVETDEELNSDIQYTQEELDNTDYSITDELVTKGGKKAKFKANIKAIELIKEIDSTHRVATTEEKAILSKYIGWGGISEAFDKNNPAWKEEYDTLRTILTDEEYEQALDSVLTAFYTPPEVIDGIYEVLNQNNIDFNNILEPACGVGNFIGRTPERYKDIKFHGVEKDIISGKIASILYPESKISIKGYEDTAYEDNTFDIAVGNVPFGNFKVIDKRYDNNNFLIHDYFFAKTLDKIKPGGIMAFITSKGTLDKANPSFRKYIAERAELIGAVRLPNKIFKEYAETVVTSDIIFLQKRDTPIEVDEDWIHLGKDSNEITLNQYFIDNPDMIIGEMKTTSGRFGAETTCSLENNEEFTDRFNRALKQINFNEIEARTITGAFKESVDITADIEIISAPVEVRPYSYLVENDKIYFKENTTMTIQKVSDTTAARIKGLIKIRDITRSLIQMQLNDYSDEEIKSTQKLLTKVYEEFVSEFGRINTRANKTAFKGDDSYALICSLEKYDTDGEFIRTADIFNKRTISKDVPITSVDTASEALAVSIANKGKVDFEYMSGLLSKDREYIIEELQGIIFKIPGEDKYVIADEYLSGNVKEKLETAIMASEEDPLYNINVIALEKVIPEDIKASDIEVRLGSTWIDTEYINDFMSEVLNAPKAYINYGDIKTEYSEQTGVWHIDGKSFDRGVNATIKYGTKRANAYRLLEDALNLRTTQIYDTVVDSEGKETRKLNKKETILANEKQELLKEEFKKWIWSDFNRREILTAKYNKLFNSNVNRTFDGEFLRFPGMNPEITLKKHQKDAVARQLYGDNTLLAHVVGAGKTFSMVAAAMESKRIGLCNKSMFVVPNHLIEQWSAEFMRLYPAANILAATKADFTPENRKKFCTRIATGDYDAIIIGHSQFEKIPLSKERQIEDLNNQIDEIISEVERVKSLNGENFTVKQMLAQKKQLEKKLSKLNDDSKKDSVINFEELGVDKLFVDEAHNYKNLMLTTKMRNVAGITTSAANKSSDMYSKCRYMDEITGGKGIVFATGTPVSNSMAELYTMQRYLQADELKKHNLMNFDSWASTFGETVTAIELAPEGNGYRTKTRFAKFHNLPELMNMFRNCADIQTSDMLDLPVPDAVYEDIVVKPTEMQKSMVEELGKRADEVRSGNIDPSIDNMLKITNDGRKLALDERLINDELSGANGKVDACVEQAYDIWEVTADQRSTQLIFCDLSTPKNDDTFSAYNEIKDKLIEKGVPEKEIEFIHDSKTDTQKKVLFEKVRQGKVRFLLGSTPKMGAGTNVQNKLVALHHLDVPWKPSDIEQQEGRILRQGNSNSRVKINRYVTEGTFDAYSWQLIENKQKFISQIMTSKNPVRSCEDMDEAVLSYAEVKALAAGNPEIKEKMDLDIEVNKLKLLKANYLAQKFELENKIHKYYPSQLKYLTERKEGLTADQELIKEHYNELDEFKMTINNYTYNTYKETGVAILQFCKVLRSKKNEEPVLAGEYCGFKLYLQSDSLFKDSFKCIIKGNLSYTVDLSNDPVGCVTRIKNAINDFESELTSCSNRLDEVKRSLEDAKKQINVPFEKEDELNSKIKRLNELNSILNNDGENEPEKTAQEMPKFENERPRHRSHEIASEKVHVETCN